MRIKNLTLEKSEIASLGLSEFHTKRLNSTLALVGKNGSGKTRYLKAIENKLKNIDVVSLLENSIEFLPKSSRNTTFSSKEKLFSFKGL